MAKRSGLAIIALLFALGGVSIGVFSYISLLTEPGVHRTYYDNRITDYTTAGEDSWSDIPDISITFQVDAGESVHFLFTCRALLIPVTAITYMHFGLKIDGVVIMESRTTVGPTTAAITNMYFSVSLQYSDSALSAGTHTVVVETMRECNGEIDNCALMVQTYT
jgi:hypothetical protein